MTNQHHPFRSSQGQDQCQGQNKNQNHDENNTSKDDDLDHHETPDQKNTNICGPFHSPSMPHLPTFRRHHRIPATKSLREAPLIEPPPSSRHLFPSCCVLCLEIPSTAAASASTTPPQSPTPAATNATLPPTPASSASRCSQETPTAATCSASLPAPDPQPPPEPTPGRPLLLQPSKKRMWRNVRVLRLFCSPFRSLPIIGPASCKLPSAHSGKYSGHIHGGIRMTGTLFGRRKARVTLAVQENPRFLPMLLLEMAIPTGKLLQEMASGLVRIALECEKRTGSKTKLTEEPVWTMFCNGRKTGYGSRREATEDDLHIMQLLHAVSMGAGVLPNKQDELGEHPDGELTYMRAFFERVVGSKDSETFYMLNPDGNSGPELSIFLVRL